MLKKLSKNIWIKIFCLFAAFVLWVFIAAGQNTVGKYPGSIQIKPINIPSGLMPIYDTSTVDVKIMAEPAVWNKLSADSFSATVDLAGHAEGTFEFPVTVASSVSGVTIVETTPSKIFIRLEQIIDKEVNINKKVEGSAAEGMVAGNITTDPDKVSIKGPKSQINNISEASIIIKLNGESEKFDKIMTPVVLDGEGEIVKNIEFNPAEIKVTVPIVKASNNKTVGVKVKTTGYPKTGYYVSNISVNPGVVDIIGASSLLNTTNYIETSPVDITNANTTIEKEAELNIINGLTLQNGTIQKVKVTISFEQAEINKEFTATINPINLLNYSVGEYVPSQIKVICTGKPDKINGLTSSDINLYLDFQYKKLSLDKETVNFDINQNNFKLPDNISITSILPSSITVNLNRK